MSLKINHLSFQGPKDLVTKKDIENEIKTENKVIKMKEKMRGTRSLQIKRNYVHNKECFSLKQIINRNLLLSVCANTFCSLALGIAI